jgi:hypothetical protein
MAKTLTKPAGLRARSAAPAKSAAKAPPARPVAKSAAKAPAARPVAKSAVKAPAAKPVAKSAVKTPAPKPFAPQVSKAPPAKPAPKAALAKAPAPRAPIAKAPPPKAPAAKAPPPKPPAKKTVPPKAPVPAVKSKPASVEQSPATEAEIMGAVSGKLSTRGGAVGFSWLGSRSRPDADEVKPLPETNPAAEAPGFVAEAPAPATPVPIQAEVAIEEEVIIVGTESVVETPVEAEVTPSTEPAAEIPPPVPAAPEETISAPESEAASLTEAPVEQLAQVPPALASVPDNHDALLQAAAKEEALARAFKAAAGQLGWTLALQGVVFAAFCVLMKGGVPPQGLPSFLANAMPLFAMVLIVAAFVSFQSTQLVLTKLEGDRLRLRQLLSPEDSTPDTLTHQRQLAHWPALIILGILFVAWFFIGVTIWFL